MSIQIQHIGFGEDGIDFAYTQIPEDVRVGGQVVMFRQVTISMKHPDYREDGDLLVAQALRMLRNALEDWEESPPYAPPADDEDDDDYGMGMG